MRSGRALKARHRSSRLSVSSRPSSAAFRSTPRRSVLTSSAGGRQFMTYSKQRNEGIRPPHRPVVLIADDEETIRAVLERYLARAGFHALSASTIEIALALLDEWSISAVIVDLRFGSADGMTLIEAVHRWHKNLAVVAFTGHPEGCDEAR